MTTVWRAARRRPGRDAGTVTARHDTAASGQDTDGDGKITLAHLTEFPDCYTRLAVLERDAATALVKKQPRPRTMELTTVVPVVTAIVSVVAILISAFVSWLTILAARRTLEKQQLGSMTAKLYDVRIRSYPKGMEFTEALRKTQIAGKVTLTPEYLNGIVAQLDTWYSSKAGFVLSRTSAQCFAELHTAIRVKPGSAGTFSPEQIDRMVKARRAFRMALRADILLLFNDDVSLTEDFLED